MESEKPNHAADARPTDQPESPWANIGFNILIPMLLLTQGDRLIANPAVVLVLALAFPAVYFIYDWVKRKKRNVISIIGFVSVLLTGGIGLLELPRSWFIVKETAIPALIGLAVLASLATRKPLIRALVYSPQIFDVDRIEAKLNERGTRKPFEGELRFATLLLACSFFLSAVLNFALASWFVRTEPSVDPVQFNAEVGAMTGWSWVVIAVPSMAIMMFIFWRLSRAIEQATGLTFEEALHPSHRDGK